MKIFWPMRLTVLVCGVFGLMSCTVQGAVGDEKTQMQVTQKAQAHSVGAQVVATVSVQNQDIYNAARRGQGKSTVAVKDAHKKDIVVAADKSVLARIKATLMQYRILSGMAVLATGAGLYFFNKVDVKQDSNIEMHNDEHKGSGVKQNSGQKSNVKNGNRSGAELSGASSSKSKSKSVLGDFAGSGKETKSGNKSAHIQSAELITQEDENGYANGVERDFYFAQSESNADDSAESNRENTSGNSVADIARNSVTTNTDVSVSRTVPRNSRESDVTALTTKQNQRNNVKSARVQQARQTAQNTQNSTSKQSLVEDNKKKPESVDSAKKKKASVMTQKEADQALKSAVYTRRSIEDMAAAVKNALDNGANMYQVTDEAMGRTLFMDAVRNGWSCVVEEFLKKEKELSKGNKDKIKKLLLQVTDKQGRTPLMYMCDDKYYDGDMINMLSILMRYGANIDAKDGNGCTALLLAIKKYDEDRGRCGMRGGQEERCIVKELRRHGANIYLTDNDGVTTLMWAVRKKCTSTIELLCDYKVQVDAQGKRSLVEIVTMRDKMSHKHPCIDEALRQFVNTLDKKGRTALIDAIDADEGSVAQYLIFRGALEQVPGCCEPDVVKYAIIKDRLNALRPLVGISGGVEFKKEGKDRVNILNFAINQKSEHAEVVSMLYMHISNSVEASELYEEWDCKEDKDESESSVSVPVKDGAVEKKVESSDDIVKRQMLDSIADIPKTVVDMIVAYAPSPFKDVRLYNKLLGVACLQGHVNNVKTLLGQSEEISYNMYKDELVQGYADASCVQENEELKQVFDAALEKIKKDKEAERKKAEWEAFLRG